MLFHQAAKFLYVLAVVRVATADDGCRDDDSVLKCYSCSSHVDPHCADMFNYSMPVPTVPCRGWCAKIVEHAGTENERIQRTCTDKMHINPFIVGNMCMEESSGRGSLCFCRKDRCNSSSPGGASIVVVMMLALVAPCVLHLFS